MRKKSKLTIIFALLFTCSLNAQILTVEITNIKSKKGKIALAVFTNNDDFKKEKPFLDETYSKADLKCGTMTIKLKLKPGVYGITVLDDKNNDGKMEYNFIGMPKEGYGFSNFTDRILSRPEFKKFDFVIGENDKTVYVKMKYF